MDIFTSEYTDWVKFCTDMINCTGELYKDLGVYIINNSLDNCPVPSLCSNILSNNTLATYQNETEITPSSNDLFKKVKEVKSRGIIVFSKADKFIGLKVYTVVDIYKKRWCNVSGYEEMDVFTSPHTDWEKFCTKMLEILGDQCETKDLYIIHDSLDNCLPYKSEEQLGIINTIT